MKKHPHPKLVVTPSQWCIRCGVHRASEPNGTYGVLCPACSGKPRKKKPVAHSNDRGEVPVAPSNRRVAHMRYTVMDEAGMVRDAAEWLSSHPYPGPAHRCFCEADNVLALPNLDTTTLQPNEWHTCTCRIGEDHRRHHDEPVIRYY